MRPAVIAIGNRWRGDDAVGPLALDAVRDRLPGDVDTVELDGEATRLIEAWADRPWVVIIDAVRRGEAAGTLHRLDPMTMALTAPGGHSTHGSGLAQAVALGAALDRCPQRLVVVGLEPASFGDGAPLSGDVAAQLPALAEAVLEEVATCA
jgi:hydrogenase maturation protease